MQFWSNEKARSIDWCNLFDFIKSKVYWQLTGLILAHCVVHHPPIPQIRSTIFFHSSFPFDFVVFDFSLFERVEMILMRTPSTSSTKHFMFHSLYCPYPMSLKSFLAKKKMIFWNVRCCHHKMNLTSTLWIWSRSRTDLTPFPSAHLSRGPLLLLHLLLSHERVQYSNFDDQ